MGYLETLHKHITSNTQWLEWSNIVSGFSDEQCGKFNCDHSAKHWLAVAKIAREFARRAGADKHTIALADIAGLLHDCGLICGDPQHAENGAQIARGFLRSTNSLVSLLDDEDVDTICHAIAQHSEGAELSSLVDAAVLFADKTHLSKERALCTDDPVVKEMAKIQRISYTITEMFLVVQYRTEEDFNPDIFFAWDKAYFAPKKVAEFLGKRLTFVINGVDCLPVKTAS